MIPLRICLENFMGHKFTDIDCSEFNSVLILGKDKYDSKSSMGIGKTTIFKAIEYVLFGYSSIILDKIIRDGCDRCQVTFEFQNNKDIYKVIRSRTKKTGKSEIKLYKKVENIWIDINEKTSSETDVELSKIIRISHIAFKHSVLFEQGDLLSFLSASSKDKKAILKEPLQIAIYNKYEKNIKDKISNLKFKIENIVYSITEIGNPNDKIIEYSILIKEAQDLIVFHESKKEQFQLELNTKLIELGTLEKSSDVLISLKKELDDFKLKQNENNKNIINLKLKIEKDNLNINNDKKTIGEIKNNISKLEKIYNELPNEELNKSNKELSLIENNKAKSKALLFQLQAEHKTYLIPSLELGTCSQCKQIITQEHKDKCEEIRLNKLKEIIKQAKIEKENLSNISLEEEKYKILIKNIIEKENIKNKISSDKEHLLKLEDLLIKYNENINNSKIELDNLIKLINIYSEKIENLNTKIIENKDQDNKIFFLKKEIDNVQISLKTSNNEISISNNILGGYKEKIDNKNKDLIKLENLKLDLKNKEKELFIKNKVLQAFGPNGIPALIINTILDDLQFEVNKLLMETKPGIELIFSVIKTTKTGQEDTLDIFYRVNGVERDFGELSGGQRMIIAFCLKLALSLIIQRRIGIEIKFLMFDEINVFLDQTTLDAIVEVIRKWQEQFKIFVITHDNKLKENSKFTHAIIVEADGENGSSGKLVTSW